MKVRTDDPAKLTDFKVLAFDCFGTLIDWETGIYASLTPLRDRLPDSHPLKHDREGLIYAYDEIERSFLPTRPALHYPTILARAYTKLHEHLLPSSSATTIEAEGEALGAAVPTWPIFPDTVRALHSLATHFHLAILSNIDRASFDAVQAPGGALHGVPFTGGVYVAGEIGSYKPDMHNFEYLFEKCAALPDGGVGKEGVLMVAHGLRSDHVPARQAGMTSAWIAREKSVNRVLAAIGGDAGEGKVEGGGGGMDGLLADIKDKAAFTWVFRNMGEMAEAVEGGGD